MDLYKAILGTTHCFSTEKPVELRKFFDFLPSSDAESAGEVQGAPRSKLFVKKGFFVPKASGRPLAPSSARLQQQQKGQSKKVFKDYTLNIRGDWEVLAEYTKQNLDKLLFTPPSPETLAEYGSLWHYNKNFDSVYLKQPVDLDTDKPLPSFSSVNSTSKDPIMQEYIETNRGNVFITAQILSTMMTMGRCVVPWHIYITKKEGKIKFDTDAASGINLPTVNEHAIDYQEEEEPESSPNHPKRLSEEADRISRAFYAKFTDKTMVDAGEPHPFSESADSAPLRYKYQLYSFNEELKVVVRTDLHVYLGGAEPKFLKLHTVNEYNSKLTGGYSVKLKKELGQVLSTELKNNSCKMSRWALEASLAGAHYLKLGFVGRQQPDKGQGHRLHYIKNFHIEELFIALNLNAANSWGVFRNVLLAVHAKPDGKYVLIKEPNRLCIKLHRVTEGSNEDEDFS